MTAPIRVLRLFVLFDPVLAQREWSRTGNRRQSLNRQLGRISWPVLVPNPNQRLLSSSAVDLHDSIAGFQSGLFGRAARDHALHQSGSGPLPARRDFLTKSRTGIGRRAQRPRCERLNPGGAKRDPQHLRKRPTSRDQNHRFCATQVPGCTMHWERQCGGFLCEPEWQQPDVIRTMCILETSGWNAWAGSLRALRIAENAHCRECPKRFACLYARKPKTHRR